jgi:hypothetical protein
MNNSLSFIFNIIDCSTLYSIGCQDSSGSGLGNMYCYDAEDGIGAGFGDGSEDYLDGSGKTSRNEQTLNFIFNIEE